MGLLDAPSRNRAGTLIAEAVDLNQGNIALTVNVYNQLAPTIAIPPGEAYTIFYGMVMNVTTAGNGALGPALRDDSAGSGGLIVTHSVRGQAWIAGTYSAGSAWRASEPFPANSTWKIYRLMAAYYRDAVGLVANVSGYGATGSTLLAGYNKSFIRAVRHA